jgi:tRNA modification GTPase
MNDDAVQVVRLTSEGRGAVAVVLVEGARAAERVERFVVRASPGVAGAGGAAEAPVSSTAAASLRSGAPSGPGHALRPINRIQHGHWGAPDGEDVVVCHVSPSEIEVHCHGGRAAIDRIAAELTGDVSESESWHDWIARHEPNAIRREARLLLAEARTERTAAILLDQYAGALEAVLAKTMEALDAERSDDAIGELQILLNRAPIGSHLVEPWRVVLAGPPNVGKSSLINALVGYNRAIVFDQPGTTRDVVTVMTAIDGWPIDLSDTAGLRTSDDTLEQAGVELARQQMRRADCIVSVVDATDLQSDRKVSGSFLDFPALSSLRVVNKCDLRPRDIAERLANERQPPHLTSAITGEGVAELATAIVKHLIGDGLRPGDAVPFTSSHVAHIRQAMVALERGARQSVRDCLDRLVA